ncbi:hypothetical protein J7438_22950 [Thalassotalea sp. G20_0]|uniref:hypothetical protein n=1 Tax=Thalassotalea sp. G20_0 TaxID=2821093 RepID=UPI001ADD2F91|nr:hypothetical protein [Thalassotalea sp. G20_0]MBO9496923.1 hypothetical protein [Thalassotalea sp. G20_0]
MKTVIYINDAEILQVIAKELNGQSISYALLRKPEGLPEKIESNDIDFIIRNDQLRHAVEIVEKVAKINNYKIIWRNSLSYIYGLILVKYFKGCIRYLKIDFFSGFSWRGIDLVDTSKLLKYISFKGYIPILNNDHMISLSFLNDILYKKKYTENNIQQYKDAIKSNKLLNEEFFLIDFSLLKLTEDEFAPTANRRKAVSQIKKQSNYYYSFLKFKLDEHQRRSKMGYQISFSGPDGSGKSTVANYIFDFFKEIKLTESLDHYLPPGFKNIHQLKLIPKTSQVKSQSYTEPYSQPLVSKPQSLIRLCYYLISFYLGYVVYVSKIKKLNKVLIFDRYFIDIISDPTRSRLSLDKRFVSKIFTLITRPELPIIFVADPKLMVERKGELSLEKALELYSKYKETSEDINAFFYQNDGTIDNAIEYVFENIFSLMEKHYEKI